MHLDLVRENNDSQGHWQNHSTVFVACEGSRIAKLGLAETIHNFDLCRKSAPYGIHRYLVGKLREACAAVSSGIAVESLNRILVLRNALNF